MSSPESLTFLEWLSLVTRHLLTKLPHLSLLEEKRTARSSLSVLLAPLEIDSNRTGIRKYVVGAVDTCGERLTADDITDFDELAHAEFGVISQILFSNGTPDESANERLVNLRIRYVAVKGNGEYAPPGGQELTGLERVILGELAILQPAESVDDGTDLLEDGSLDHSEYLLILALRLYLEQEEVLHPPAVTRQQVGMSQGAQGGGRSLLALGIAVKQIDQGGEQIQFCYPSTPKLIEGIQYAIGMQGRLDRLRVPSAAQPTKQILIDFSREIHGYYASWLSGACKTVRAGRVAVLVETLRSEPHARLLSRSLADLGGVEQLGRVSLLAALGARGCAVDILSLIDEAGPPVQEACLEALRAFNVFPNISALEALVGSRREAVSKAAIDLLAAMGGEDAATILIELIKNGSVPLTEHSVKAISRTRSKEAFAFLLNLCARYNGNVPPLGLEACLDHFTPLLNSGQTRFSVDAAWALQICEKLYGVSTETVAVDAAGRSHVELGRRVALKIIRIFRLSEGRDLVRKALVEDSVRTRIWAMRAAAVFPEDTMASSVVESATTPLREGDPFKEWLLQSITVAQGHEGPGGVIHSVADLDLAACAAETLKSMGTEFFARMGASLPSVPTNPSGAATPKIGGIPLALSENVYATPDGGHVWLSTMDHEIKLGEEPNVLATIVHGQIAVTPHPDTAAAMLGGGMTPTTGSRTAIRDGVVRALLRGEEPRLPLVAGMGEAVVTNKREGTREVIKLDSPRGEAS